MANWELGHKVKGSYDTTHVQIEAATPWDAVTALREQIGDAEIVSSVRRVD